MTSKVVQYGEECKNCDAVLVMGEKLSMAGNPFQWPQPVAESAPPRTCPRGHEIEYSDNFMELELDPPVKPPYPHGVFKNRS